MDKNESQKFLEKSARYDLKQALWWALQVAQNREAGRSEEQAREGMERNIERTARWVRSLADAETTEEMRRRVRREIKAQFGEVQS